MSGLYFFIQSSGAATQMGAGDKKIMRGALQLHFLPFDIF